jgi:predicted nuclease of restriction endonuclease-like (RecB) superfamily
MRSFYLGWEILQTPSAKFEARIICPARLGDSPASQILPTLSGNSPEPAKQPILQTVSAESGHSFDVGTLSDVFPLSWSHYVRLMSVDQLHARAFYETESIRGGWSVRQLDRQIGTQFFERTSHSKQQAAMLARGQKSKPEDAVSAEDEVRDPYLLEFLNLKDEYSEAELEEALIRNLEAFLLELGAGFTFVARQKRIRIGHMVQLIFAPANSSFSAGMVRIVAASRPRCAVTISGGRRRSQLFSDTSTNSGALNISSATRSVSPVFSM